MTKLFPEWAQHFASNDWTNSPELAWETAPRLSGSASESELWVIAPALAQFQLGEYAQGRSLLSRAAAFEAAHGIPGLAEATRSFIQEEQRHSLVLGRFLAREGVKLMEHDWTDAVFRWVRKRAGLELIVTVLSTAECIAVPYYSALRDLTSSELLRSICQNILRDEALHLCYQGHVLALFSRERGFWAESLARTLHRMLLLGSGCLVYAQHAWFFRTASMPLKKFLGRAFQSLAQIEQRTGGGALVGFGWLPQGRA